MKKIMLAIFCIFAAMCEAASASVAIRMESTAALLDRNGKVLVEPGAYADILRLSDTRFAAKSDGRYALMDDAGELLTEAVYDCILPDGIGFRAEADGHWGALKPDGSVLVETEYRQIVFADGFVWAVTDGNRLIRISADGEELVTPQRVERIFAPVSEGLLCVRSAQNGKFGYVDPRGDYAIAPYFEYAEPFVNGAAAVTLVNGRGAIDRAGEWILSPDFEALEISAAGFISASIRDEGAYLYDFSGNEIASFSGKAVSAAILGEYVLIRDGESLSVSDAFGSVLLETDSDAFVSAGIDGALIVSTGAWGEKCVSLAGSETLYQDLFPLGRSLGEPIYGYLTVPAARYMNDLLGEIQISADMDSAQFGIADENGEPLTDSAYLSLEYLEDDRLLVRTADDWQMIDARGNVIWSMPVSAGTSG